MENNELIRVFMGYSRPESEELNKKCVQALKYHSDWNQLMPVVEKISKMPLLKPDNTPCTHIRDTCYPRTFNMPIEDGKSIMFRFGGFSLHTAEKLIDACYNAVIEVIEFHNSQSK